MVYKSTITVEVPQVDLLSWVFGGDEYDDDRPVSDWNIFASWIVERTNVVGLDIH